MDGMNVYDFAPDLDLSKEVEVVIGVFFMIVIRINVYYRVVIVV